MGHQARRQRAAAQRPDQRGVSLRFRVLGSGSTGNATLVEGGGVRILLDAGLGPRELAERLQSVGVDPASVDALFTEATRALATATSPPFAR